MLTLIIIFFFAMIISMGIFVFCENDYIQSVAETCYLLCLIVISLPIVFISPAKHYKESDCKPKVILEGSFSRNVVSGRTIYVSSDKEIMVIYNGVNQ